MRKSMDRTVDRTTTQDELEDTREMVSWLNDQNERLNNENVRQRITILELIRILAPNYGK